MSIALTWSRGSESPQRGQWCHRWARSLGAGSPHTGLAGVAWIHGDRLSAGSRRLADKDRDELAPRGVANRLGQAVVLDHVLDPQALVADHVERHDERVRLLVLEVAAPQADPRRS
jgi:hypothetical protein